MNTKPLLHKEITICRMKRNKEKLISHRDQSGNASNYELTICVYFGQQIWIPFQLDGEEPVKISAQNIQAQPAICFENFQVTSGTEYQSQSLCMLQEIPYWCLSSLDVLLTILWYNALPYLIWHAAPYEKPHQLISSSRKKYLRMALAFHSEVQSLQYLTHFLDQNHPRSWEKM